MMSGCRRGRSPKYKIQKRGQADHSGLSLFCPLFAQLRLFMAAGGRAARIRSRKR